MLLRRTKHKTNGQSVIEFAVLILILLTTFLVFQKYIVRGISGRWKDAGDALGQGRIYDYYKTTECRFARFFESNPGHWFNEICFEKNCIAPCLKTGRTAVACDACLIACADPMCN